MSSSALPRSSDRLQFRWWKADDLGHALALWGDPRVTEMIDARGPLTREMVSQLLADQLAMAEDHGMQYWPVFERDSGEHVGCAGLRPYAPEPGLLEIGFHIRHDRWGQGFGREAAWAVMQHALEHRRVEGLFAGHHPANERSGRLLSSLGFAPVAAEFYGPTGLMHPSYVLRAEQWKRVASKGSRR